MSKLFSDDEGSGRGDDVQLTINEHYAKAFEYRKEREELERLKAKYGSDYDPDASGSDFSVDSESAESEDEDGGELTPAVDAAILRTLARIKKKDPAIYDSTKDIFGEERKKISSKPTTFISSQAKPKEKVKPVNIRQANLDTILNGSRSPSPDIDGPQPETYVQEQEKLRKDTIAAFHNAVPAGEEEDFLIPREKTQDELKREEEEYRAFLEREVGDLRDLVSVDGHSSEEEEHELPLSPKDHVYEDEAGDEASKTKKKKKKQRKVKEGDEATNSTTKRKKSNAEADQAFLMNYILNRGWIDQSDRHVPTYKEITSTTADQRRSKGKAKADAPPADGGEDQVDEDSDNGLLSDASFDSLASHFEASYNHRFEEPDAATIPSFPRSIPSAVRRPDTTRKDARERKKTRKEEELAKKKEEVKRLKALKMREVKRKLEMISRQGGLTNVGRAVQDDEGDDLVDEALRELDLEGDWDPDKHDRQMAGLFDKGADAFEDDVFYADADNADEEGVVFDAEGKPVWDDDIDIGNIPISDDDAVYAKRSKKEKKKEKKKKNKMSMEDEGGVDIDAMDADAEPQVGDDEEWDGTEEMRKRKLNEYMDEIYGLDFNDMVGDLPTRFKYMPVQPTNYSLTPAEILMATDKELNEYVSVKKYAPYRQDNPEKHRYNKNNQEKLHDLKTKVNERSGGALGFGTGRPGRGNGEEKPKKRKGKKERMKMKSAPEEEEKSMDSVAAVAGLEEGGKKSKKRQREHEELTTTSDLKEVGEVAVDGGEDGELPKKKRKRRHKKEGEVGE